MCYKILSDTIAVFCISKKSYNFYTYFISSCIVMKKNHFFISAVLSLLAITWVSFAATSTITNVDQLPESCIQATDQYGNMCHKTDTNVWACTLMYSETQHPIQCIASKDDEDIRNIACTMEYAPVCGQIPVQCITAPCPSVTQTFGNMCMANAAWATGLIQGECTTDTWTVIGWDKDSYGCLIAAGYSWDESSQSCTRSWESTYTWHIVWWDSDEHGCKWSAGYTRNVAKKQCTRSREDKVKSSCKIEDKDLQIYSKDKSSVKVLQAQLKKLGYFKIKPTGNFGKITQQALQKFQKDNGIQSTGKLWPITRHALQQVCTVK